MFFGEEGFTFRNFLMDALAIVAADAAIALLGVWSPCPLRFRGARRPVEVYDWAP
jgi:hypothetical protein